MQKSPVLKEKVQYEAGQLLRSCLIFGQNLYLINMMFWGVSNQMAIRFSLVYNKHHVQTESPEHSSVAVVQQSSSAAHLLLDSLSSMWLNLLHRFRQNFEFLKWIKWKYQQRSQQNPSPIPTPGRFDSQIRERYFYNFHEFRKGEGMACSSLNERHFVNSRSRKERIWKF